METQTRKGDGQICKNRSESSSEHGLGEDCAIRGEKQWSMRASRTRVDKSQDISDGTQNVIMDFWYSH